MEGGRRGDRGVCFGEMKRECGVRLPGREAGLEEGRGGEGIVGGEGRDRE